MANNLKLINTNTINSKPIRNYIKIKNTGGPKGDTGATGATGPQGPQGPAGQAATINIGETTTLLPGQTATVTNTGTQQNATLNFGIPQGLRGPTGAQGPKGDTGPQGLKGDKGNDGAAATIQVNATNTGEPGTNAQVVNIGNEHFAQLNFTIPRGATGATGAQGPRGPQGQKGDKGDAGSAATVTVGSTTTTSPGTSATVTNSGTTSAAVLNFGIPSGAPGKVKSEVVAELPDSGEDDTFYLVNREATTQTVTGKIINFTNSENAGDITDAQIDGETAQTTYTGKNLFQVTATSPSVSSGVTYTKISDTSFSVKSDGTASWARADIALPQALATNTTYTFKVNFTSTNSSITSVRASFRTDSAEASTFTLTNGQSAELSTGSNTITTIRLYISTNTAYSGTVTFTNVQLESGSSATAYEPYVGGKASPNPNYPQAIRTVTGENVIEICGKNIFNLATPATNYGVTVTANADGSFTLNGKTTGIAIFNFILPTLKPAGAYTISCTSENQVMDSGFFIRARNQNMGMLVPGGENGPSQIRGTGTNYVEKTFISTDPMYCLAINLTTPGMTYNNMIIYPQVESGSQATAYEAYKSQSYEVNLGKNLLTFGNSDISGTLNGITYSYNAATQEWTFDGTASARADVPYPSGTDINMHLRSGIKYTTTGFYQSGTISGGSIKLFQQDSHHNWQGITVTMSSAATNAESYTPSAELVLDDSHIFRIASGTVLSNYKVKFQTEIAPGTSYAPYFTPIELCKIGDYQDYIWNDNGTWKKHKAIGKVILNGSETWHFLNDGGTFKRYYTDSYSSSVQGLPETTGGLSDHFGYAGVVSGADVVGKIYFNKSSGTNYANGNITVTISGLASTADAIDDWMTSNNTTLYHALANPTDETITNATLIAQLDALAGASLYSGVNNITTITPNELPTLELDYVTYDKYNQNKVYIWNDDLEQWQIIVQ